MHTSRLFGAVRTLVWILILPALTSVPAKSFVASLSSVSWANIQTYYGGTVYCGPSSSVTCQGEDTQYGYTYYGDPIDVSWYTYGAADYGILKAYGQATASNPYGDYVLDVVEDPDAGFIYYDSQLRAYTISSFRDQWIINGMPIGTTGTLELLFDITGIWDESATGGAHLGYAGQMYDLTLRNYNSNTTTHDGQLPPYMASLITQFTFGESLDFEVSLTGGSVIGFFGLNGISGSLSSYVDMSNTALLSSIVVRDNAGNVVPFGLTTASGAAIFNSLTTVPIPAALWLFGSGLLGLVGIARRKRVA